MGYFTSTADLKAIEDESSWEDRKIAHSIYDYLSKTRMKHGTRPAITFQLLSDPKSSAETLTWNRFHAQVTQAANLFRSLGGGEKDVVAYVLPNTLETAITFLGGAVAGIVNPINPLLEAEKISAILRETKAKVVVTLKAFPKTDLAQKVAEAVKHAPDVKTVLEVDLVHYLTGAKRLIVPLIRPKNPVTHTANVKNFHKECQNQLADRLTFVDTKVDRVAAYFHTGGTTGMPKVAQHMTSGMIYNGWLGSRLLFTEADCVMCPLPLFHVFAAYPILMSMLGSGAHVVFPTPQGYRGEGVFDNLWKLIARYKCTYLITVPTALSALMQRPIDADISTIRGTFSGSAPLPLELFNKFEKATGVQIIEGYGLTECTCLVTVNPPGGAKKNGSVGLTFPHTNVKILTGDGAAGLRECGVDEVGEICVSSPGVYAGHTYTETEKNRDLYAGDKHLRTGDLGRIDADGYLYITGRAKDLIIRGGHNIDPAIIEEALMGHDAVAFVGAIGQPDAHAGEVPAAFVELIKGATVTAAELMAYCASHIHEKAAIPKHVEILAELPKTAVGKVFKPDLRRSAIIRVFNAALEKAGMPARVVEVAEDNKRGLVAKLSKSGVVTDDAIKSVLGDFTTPWDWN